MVKVRIVEEIKFRSAPLTVNQEIEVSALDASQLVAAGHAVVVTKAGKAPKPEKTTGSNEHV
ncbi:hypothetical protein [Azonexus sp.]|uniref:hypothetical protein n=1 Tax=Azonexus sp. TaxID=1872668 RepID=UPI0027B92390|nr:hypothetical protein [Azonexus sp.]